MFVYFMDDDISLSHRLFDFDSDLHFILIQMISIISLIELCVINQIRSWAHLNVINKKRVKHV